MVWCAAYPTIEASVILVQAMEPPGPVGKSVVAIAKVLTAGVLTEAGTKMLCAAAVSGVINGMMVYVNCSAWYAKLHMERYVPYVVTTTTPSRTLETAPAIVEPIIHAMYVAAAMDAKVVK